MALPSSTTFPPNPADRSSQHHDTDAPSAMVGEDITRVPTTTSSSSRAPNLVRTFTSRSARYARNERRASQQRSSVDYDLPASYQNLDDVYGQPPVQNPDEEPVRRVVSREDSLTDGRSMETENKIKESRMARRRSSAAQVDYDVPDQYANLYELVGPSPVQNPDEEQVYLHENLEEQRSLERIYTTNHERQAHAEQQAEQPSGEKEEVVAIKVSRLATQIYTHSYLIIFSILGTLARLGLQALTYYPGAPIPFTVLWPNFTGSLIMGFLSEDRMLFLYEWGTPTYDQEIQKARGKQRDEENGSGLGHPPTDLAAAKKAYLATKKTIPLYIGLATGFCGSITSFSSFIRDIFLALSNRLASADVDTPTGRNGGYDFMALIGVTIITLSVSLSGLFIGAHLAIALEPFTPSLPYMFTRKVLDRLAVFLAAGCWMGAIILSAIPPEISSRASAKEVWHGTTIIAVAFAPLGCLGRFYLSLKLNGKSPSFPLGTFTANILGTAVLGAAWSLQHAPIAGVVGCQIWQGIMDGFCGCLTTLSTFAAELLALRRRHAYTYGGVSIGIALAILVAAMGGLIWSRGAITDLDCVT